MATKPPSTAETPHRGPALRRRVHRIIFGTDTAAGMAFDIALLFAILASVAVVMLESVRLIDARLRTALWVAEWTFTILFTIEYAVRLWCVRKPIRYALSFFGVVDLLAIIPTYLSVFVAGSQSLMVIRTLRLVRVFRVFQLARFLDEARLLSLALRATAAKITVFLVVIFTVVVILGASMYLIEGAEHGFTSIPRSVYWAIVTVTTVGYGDIAPQTIPGQTLAALAMILGYSIIIVPTGIFSAEIIAQRRPSSDGRICPGCRHVGHDVSAWYCCHCGAKL